MEATQQRGEVYYLGEDEGIGVDDETSAPVAYIVKCDTKSSIYRPISLYFFAFTSYLIRTQHLFYSTNSFIYYLFAIVYIILSTQFTLYNTVAMAPH